MSWWWIRTRRCTGGRRPAGSSLRRMWRRTQQGGGNPMWLHCPSAACWSSGRQLPMVSQEPQARVCVLLWSRFCWTTSVAIWLLSVDMSTVSVSRIHVESVETDHSAACLPGFALLAQGCLCSFLVLLYCSQVQGSCNGQLCLSQQVLDPSLV